MESEKLRRASQLIQAQRYAEARRLLQTIDHEKAREWLAKLDERAPVTQNTLKTGQREPSSLPLLIGLAISLASILVTLLAVILVPPFIQSITCPVSQWYTQVGPQVVQFFDLNDTAQTTPRADLAPVLAQMQQVQQALMGVGTPACLIGVRSNLLTGMTTRIETYQAYEGTGIDVVVFAQLTQSDSAFRAANAGLLQLGFTATDPRLGAAEPIPATAISAILTATRANTLPVERPTLPPTWTPAAGSRIDAIAGPNLTAIADSRQSTPLPVTAPPPMLTLPAVPQNRADFVRYLHASYASIGGVPLEIEDILILDENVGSSLRAVTIELSRDSALYVFADQTQTAARDYGLRLLWDAAAYFGGQDTHVAVSDIFYTTDLLDIYYDTDWYYIGDYRAGDGWYVSHDYVKGQFSNGMPNLDVWNFR